MLSTGTRIAGPPDSRGLESLAFPPAFGSAATLVSTRLPPPSRANWPWTTASKRRSTALTLYIS